MAKKLIVCCDGTWNTPDEEHDGVPTPTNVVRLFNALNDQPDQLKYYHPGVGSEGNWWEKIAGGAFGSGLSKHIMSAYKWLADNYQKDDQIFIFGFSRGAFTARSLGGMISRSWLLDPSGLSDDDIWKRVETAYKGYQHKQKPTREWGSGWKFHEATPDGTATLEKNEIPIHFLGVWDTVGALGIPDDLAILSLLDNRDNYSFHDTALTTKVKHARHAVAIDEMRASFFPTLWSNEDSHPGDVEQVWFPGVHSDVGGGYPETGLSNGALLWMIDEVSNLVEGGQNSGLVFDQAITNQIKANPQDVLHDSRKGAWKLLRTQPRSIPLLAAGATEIHSSALTRQAAPPITQAPYRKTIRLDVGETRALPIYAAQQWNETGIYIKTGETYEFTATGQWMDRSIKCGPGGTHDGKFQPGEMVHVMESLWGKAEKLFRNVTGNEHADFKGTKRYEDEPWFALLGIVANAGNPNNDGTPPSLKVISIKDSYPQPPASPFTYTGKPGYLCCFANDAWNFYGNNTGSVKLTIKRTA